MNPTKQKQRILFFDILETIAIYMVVFCHYTTLGSTFADNAIMTLCFVAVPIFFMINGALTLTRGCFDYKKHFRKIAWRYLSAVVFRGIYLSIRVFSGAVVFTSISRWSLFSYLFFWTKIPGCDVGHMWFMQTLLAIGILTPLLYYALFDENANTKTIIYVLAVLFVPFVVQACDTALAVLRQVWPFNSEVSFYGISNFNPFGYGQNMAFFYVLGAWIWKNKNSVYAKNSRKARTTMLVGFICSWFLMLLTKRLLSGTWQWNGELFENGYRHISTAFAAFFLFAYMMLCMNPSNDENKKFLKLRCLIESVSSNTLGIYYLHWIVGAATFPFVLHQTLWTNSLRAVMVLVISYGISFVISKIPFLRGLIR